MLRQPKIFKSKPHVAHRHAVKQEEKIAESIGAKQVKGSGCGDERGDSRIRKVVRVENKCTTHKKSFSITRKMAQKIEDAALPCGEMPIIEFEFINERGIVEHSLVVVPAYVLKSIVEHYESGAL